MENYLAYALTQCDLSDYLTGESALNLRATCETLRRLIECKPVTLGGRGGGRGDRGKKALLLKIKSRKRSETVLSDREYPKLAVLKISDANVKKIFHATLSRLCVRDCGKLNEIRAENLKTLKLRNCFLEFENILCPNLRVLDAEDAYIFAPGRSFMRCLLTGTNLRSVTNHLFLAVYDINSIGYDPRTRGCKEVYPLRGVEELRVSGRDVLSAWKRIKYHKVTVQKTQPEYKYFKIGEVLLRLGLPNLTRVVGHQLNQSVLRFTGFRKLKVADLYANLTYMDIFADGEVPFWRFINHCPKLRYLRLRDMRRRRRPPVFAHPTLETLILEDNSLKRPNRSFTYLSLDTPNLKKLVLVGAKIRELPACRVIFRNG